MTQSLFSSFNQEYGIVFAVFAPCSAIINGLLVVSFIATKQVNLNSSNFLIFWMSIVDFINGSIGFSLLAAAQLEPGFDKATPSTIVYFLGQWSGIITLLIAIDRYLHINPNINERSYRAEKVFKKPWLYCLIFAAAVFSIVVSTSSLYLKTLGIIYRAAAQITIALIVFMVMLSVTCLYIKALVRIRKFTNQNPIHSGYSNNPVNQRPPKYVEELFKTVLLLVIAAVLAYTPFCVIGIVISGYQLAKIRAIPSSLVEAYNIAIVLFFTTYMTNGMIVLYRNKAARNWLQGKLSLLCKTGKKRNESYELGIVNPHLSNIAV